METQQTFYLNDGFPSPPYSELKEEDLRTTTKYAELIRHLEEIHELFLVFKFNLDSFISRYRVTSSGKVYRDDKLADTYDDYIAINSLVISIISAGKTMVESMYAYTKANYEEESQVFAKLQEFTANVYDQVFPYRLLLRLRNYAQHGHLPISQNGGWYGFEATSFVKKPHFDHNGKLLGEMSAAIQKVSEKYGDSFIISLADLLAQYTPNILSICRFFWNEIEEGLLKTEKSFRSIVEKYPENIFAREECPPGLFSYNLVNHNLDVAFLGDSTGILIRSYKKEEEMVCEEYEAAWKAYCDDRTVLRITEDGKIEFQSFKEFMES